MLAHISQPLIVAVFSGASPATSHKTTSISLSTVGYISTNSCLTAARQLEPLTSSVSTFQ